MPPPAGHAARGPGISARVDARDFTAVWRHFCVMLAVFCLCASVKCRGSHESDGDGVGGESIQGRHRGRQCRHAHPRAHEVVTGVQLDSGHSVKKRSAEQPLRIVLYYDHSVYRLEPEKFDLINNTILPGAVQFWEKTLMVRKTADVIKLNRKCSSRQVFVKNGRTHCIGACKAVTTCGEVQVPEEHLNPCYVCNATGHGCGQLQPPPAPAPGVPDADFVLYVSAVETERCTRGLTVAYAAHCQQEAALDRPIAGHANFCPSELSTRPQELGSMLSTVQHEMLHALGFSVSLFAFYRDDEGNPLTERNPDTGSPPLNEELQVHQWSDKVVRNLTRERWMVRGGFMTRNIQVMVTPRVVKEVRDHYGCSSLEGAELEDQGGEGTALTHWEKRIMENEAMTGTHTQNPVFSRITLALMEDTGWYRADYTQAQELSWGRDLGCSFVTRSCKEWINSAAGNEGDDPDVDLGGRSAHPFCSRVKRDPLQTECSQLRDSVALCNLVLHERPLPPLYQHFDWVADAEPGTEGSYGGSVSLADYCPYTQEFTWKFKSQVVRGSRCSFADNNPHEDKNFALESYGENSKCFDHTNRMWEQRSCRQVRQWQHWGSGCYNYKCEGGRLHLMDSNLDQTVEGALSIQLCYSDKSRDLYAYTLCEPLTDTVGNYSYECYHSGQEISIRIVRGGWLHRGALLCPPCRDLCQKQFQARGEWCKPGDEAPPNTAYPRDDLSCGSGAGGASRPPPARLHLVAVAISLGALAASAVCLCSGVITKIQGGVRHCRKRNAAKFANQKNKSKFKLEEVVVSKKIPGADEYVPDEALSSVVTSPSHEECASYASCSKANETRRSTFEDAVRSVLDQDPMGIQEKKFVTNAEPVDNNERNNEAKRKQSKNCEDTDEIKRFDTGRSSSFKGKRGRKDSKGRDSKRKVSKQRELEMLDEPPGYFKLDEPVLKDEIELEMIESEQDKAARDLNRLNR